MTVPIGWYVRVRTDEIVDGVYDTVLYIAGYPTPAEAEAAVRNVRLKSGEQCEVLEGGIIAGCGPQPQPGEVRLLTGAV
jgi:hypothetical protein